MVQRCEEPVISNITGPSGSSGPCPAVFWSSGSLFTFNSSRNAPPDPAATGAICTPAARKDVACEEASNKFCLLCAAGKRLVCVAAGGQACTAKDATGAAVFNLCTDAGNTTAFDKASGCFASIKAGSSAYALQTNGKGVLLDAALNHSCPVPGKAASNGHTCKAGGGCIKPPAHIA